MWVGGQCFQMFFEGQGGRGLNRVTGWECKLCCPPLPVSLFLPTPGSPDSWDVATLISGNLPWLPFESRLVLVLPFIYFHLFPTLTLAASPCLDIISVPLVQVFSSEFAANEQAAPRRITSPPCMCLQYEVRLGRTYPGCHGYVVFLSVDVP